MKKSYSFTTTELPIIDQVGGKALSLISMTKEGMPVPPGFILTVSFFDPWINSLQKTTEWVQVQKTSEKELALTAQALKKLSGKLQFSDEQRKELKNSLRKLQETIDVNLLAIRSSSPEEDIEEASFAGTYESILGVTVEGIEAAIIRVFASCFDERVFIYKKARGISLEQLRIAIIVQQQVDAESAGVAFSLNPMNNCYDEAVIIANFGLGESVVSGQITPDTFIIDKIKRNILETKIGSKELIIQLNKSGGTTTTSRSSSNQACITSEQLLILTDLLGKVESYYQKPIDIEWAFTKGELFLLQARPITTYLPLPKKMLTVPGKPKLLYADSTLIEQGIQEPLSVLGTDYLNYILKQMNVPFGDKVININGLVFTAGGRYYLHLSNSRKMMGSRMPLAPGSIGDAGVKEILDNIDFKQYLPKKLSKNLRKVRRLMVITTLPSIITGLLAFRKPEAFKRRYENALPNQLQKLQEISEKQLSIHELATDLTSVLNFFFMGYGLPMIIIPQLAQYLIKRMFKKEVDQTRDAITSLGMALPGNKTTEMGELMYKLAASDDIKSHDSSEKFIKKLQNRSLNSELLEKWDLYMKEFGFRCIREIDVATSRPNEQPSLLYNQLSNMSVMEKANENSKTIFENARTKREEAYQLLYSLAHKKGKRKAKKFEKHYKKWFTFGGFRETPKHYVTLVIDLFRKRILQIAQTFVNSQRLDYLEQIFDLTIDDLDKAINDSTIDLRTLAKNNNQIINMIRRSQLAPQIIDSRGKIFRPPRKEITNGELVGYPISPGIVKGKVKVIHHLDDKELSPGEILVARSTDPGWTPLFINAKGIVLEIGGVLQHGAVVAREYGIPCVSGIERATQKLHDGQIVEIDGSNGIVRIISEEINEKKKQK